VTSTIVEIILTVVKFILLPFIKIVGKWLNSLTEHDAIDNVAQHSRRVVQLLTETRAVFKCARTSLIMFHNGDYFLDDTPVWKMTCVYEVVANGISRHASQMQNMIAQQWWELLEPLYNEQEKSPDGYIPRRKMFGIVTNGLQDDNCRAFLKNRGTECLIGTALYHKEYRHRVIGMITIEYSNELDDTWWDKLDRSCDGGNCTDIFMNLADSIEHAIHYPELQRGRDDDSN